MIERDSKFWMGSTWRDIVRYICEDIRGEPALIINTIFGIIAFLLMAPLLWFMLAIRNATQWWKARKAKWETGY